MRALSRRNQADQANLKEADLADYSTTPTVLDPIEFYKVRVGFMSTDEGGRRGPICWTFGAYRPDFIVDGRSFHGAVFMDAPSEIAPGDQVDVEISFWCCKSHHDLNPGDKLYLHEGRPVAEGTILRKGVKQYARPD
jgi:hypothetical protein